MSTLPMRGGDPTWTWAADYLAVLASARRWSDGAYTAVRSYLNTLASTYDESDRTGWAAYAAFLSALPESVYPGSTALAAAMASAAVETDDDNAAAEAASWWAQVVGAAELSAADVADGATAIREAGTAAATTAGNAARSSWFLPMAGLTLAGFLAWRVTR